MTNTEGTDQEKKGEKPGESINNGKQPDLAQARYKDEKEKYEGHKRDVELEILEIRKRKLKCFLRLLSILLGFCFLVLIGGGILVFCSIKEACNNTYNWIRLIFGSIMMVSFVVLIIFLCHLIKKLVSHSDEE